MAHSFIFLNSFNLKTYKDFLTRSYYLADATIEINIFYKNMSTSVQCQPKLWAACMWVNVQIPNIEQKLN